MRPGYVYLIHADTGHYKIGWASDPAKRLRIFSVEMPIAVTLIHAFPASNAPMAEAALHKQYAKNRVRGEWFDLTSEQVLAIKDIVDYGNGKQPLRISDYGGGEDEINLYSFAVRGRLRIPITMLRTGEEGSYKAIDEFDFTEAFWQTISGDEGGVARVDKALDFLHGCGFLRRERLYTLSVWGE